MRGTQNVWVNDASLLPDAPGVNPQASVMALAIRNARRFVGRSSGDGARRTGVRSRPPTLRGRSHRPTDLTIVTGAGGWLGRALVDHLVRDGGPYAATGSVRALVATPRT